VNRRFEKLFEGIEDFLKDLGSWWMLSHLADLFHHAGVRDEHDDNFIEMKREEFFSQHAKRLANEDLITFVPAYLTLGCPLGGKDDLKVFLPQIPITSEKQASLLLSICKTYQLEDSFQNNIKKTIAQQMNDKKQYCAALKWYIGTDDDGASSAVSNTLLNTVVKRINQCDAPLIKMILNEMQCQAKIAMPTDDELTETNDIGRDYFNNLQFLVVFHSVVSAFQAEKYDLVESGLVSLLKGVAPKRFWLLLLLDAKMLIETRKIIFGPTETSLLMRALDQISETLHDEYLVQDKDNNWPLLHQNLKNVFVQNYSKSVLKNGSFGVASNAIGMSVY